MGKGSDLGVDEIDQQKGTENLPSYTWEEIKNDKSWVVVDGFVYDVTNFSKKHPGGPKIIKNHIGQDASDAFKAFHNSNLGRVKKYMNSIRVGKVCPTTANIFEEESRDEINADFQNLKMLAEKMDLYRPNYIFYMLHFLQLILLDLVAWTIIYYSGYQNWFTYLFAAALMATAQAQAGWLQHDFGHLSVFKSSKMNHLVQRVIICWFKGVSADWWNFRHYIHHAKPNAIVKDPDMRFYPLLVLGKILPREVGLKKKKPMPYNFQQFYFFMVLPPLLLPLYFNFEQTYFLIKRGLVKESLWVLSFFVRWFIMFVPILGFGGAIALYVIVRFLESHWFVWTTQMSHLPMHIDHDKDMTWFRRQLLTSCNVEQSFFNDWFSGHLNFQIEHHLFPTMPRHNCYRIAPYVKSMCEKHKISYLNKTLTQAMADIYHCLKESGEMWYDAYNM